MTFPTAEDMLITDDSGYGDFILCLFPRDERKSKEECESLKQQILSEHEIVERLKNIINENIDSGCCCEYGGCRHSFAEELKSILENKPQ